MSRHPRELWIDTRGEPVVTTTPNGRSNALRWGWVEARAVPQGLIRDLEALTRQESSGRMGGDVSCGGRDILADGCHAGDLAQQILDVLAKHLRGGTP